MGNPEEVARRQELEHKKLQRMIEYADTAICLHATILQYFGDLAVRDRCASCGNCRPGAIDAHERELVRTILSGIADAGARYGRNRIIAMLTGNIGDLPPSLTKARAMGALRHEAADALRGWIQASIAAGLVAVSQDQYRTLRLTEQGRTILQGIAHDLRITRPARFPRFPTERRARADRAHPFDADPRIRYPEFRIRNW